MAWTYTNSPSGRYATDCGLIMSEILTAINERQHMMGKAETAWTDVGANPAQNAFAGKPASSLRVAISEARAAFTEKGGSLEDLNIIVNDSTNYLVKSTDASWNEYNDLATLYNVAMGSGTTWEKDPATGNVRTDTNMYEELMKCVEAIANWHVYPSLAGLVVDRNGIEDAGPEADTDDIHDAAVASGVSSSVLAGVSEWVFAVVDENNVTGNYEDYANRFVVHKINKPPSSSPFPTVDQFRIEYDVLDTVGLNSATDDLDWKLRTISAAEYSGPAWSGDGTLRDSQTFSSTTSGSFLTYTSPAWIADGSPIYLRYDGGTSNPFPVDPGNDRSTYIWVPTDEIGDSTSFRLRHSYTGWTYA
jgi:hypothetical protein